MIGMIKVKQNGAQQSVEVDGIDITKYLRGVTIRVEAGSMAQLTLDVHARHAQVELNEAVVQPLIITKDSRRHFNKIEVDVERHVDGDIKIRFPDHMDDGTSHEHFTIAELEQIIAHARALGAK